MRIIVLTLALLVLLPLGTIQAVGSDDVSERREQLKRDLAALEAEIDNQSVFLEEKQRERVSLERDIAILDAEIEKAQLSIRARDLSIRSLTNDIGEKSETITELDKKLTREKESLANILRKTNEIDDHTLAEFVLASKDVSDFFADVDAFAVIKASLRESFYDIEDTKDVTAEERTALETRRAEEQELRTLQVLERRKIEERQEQRSEILRVTQGEEDAYQDLINSIEKTASEIRAELFSLRDSAAIPFGQALDLAERAGSAVGVRPALILAILKQETRLGEFLGSGSWRIDMHPTRDQPVFTYIMDTLGLDPDSVPVSQAPSYGWGGAMGPSQFIPSTWVCYGGFINVKTGDCNNASRSMSWDAFWQGPWEYRANKDRIRVALKGSDPSNPYNNEDAFTATGMLMADNGADRGTYSSERLAALRYFAGWTNAENPRYAFYGDGVMGFADEFQALINQLAGS